MIISKFFISFFEVRVLFIYYLFLELTLLPQFLSDFESVCVCALLMKVAKNVCQFNFDFYFVFE